MLLEVNNEDYDIQYLIKKKCGKQYSILQRIINKNFGSFRYQLLNISKNKFNINFENYNDTVYLNFDLRARGMVFYFRYQNSEYVEFCPFYSLTFQSNDSSFIMQSDVNSYTFKIMNVKKHKKFILKLYEFKNKKLNK
mgnify:CR=1 FL=1|tara:strand:- start:224 stop:637 length:414 start_codon:yes stop_codon:yes gene_type:complete